MQFQLTPESRSKPEVNKLQEDSKSTRDLTKLKEGKGVIPLKPYVTAQNKLTKTKNIPLISGNFFAYFMSISKCFDCYRSKKRGELRTREARERRTTEASLMEPLIILLMAPFSPEFPLPRPTVHGLIATFGSSSLMLMRFRAQSNHIIIKRSW